MNSRNMEKDSNGWGRRDNRPNKFKKDFSGQDFYNQDWKNKPKKQQEHAPKIDKSFNIQENYFNLVSSEFEWINQCIL